MTRNHATRTGAVKWRGRMSLGALWARLHAGDREWRVCSVPCPRIPIRRPIVEFGVDIRRCMQNPGQPFYNMRDESGITCATDEQRYVLNNRSGGLPCQCVCPVDGSPLSQRSHLTPCLTPSEATPQVSERAPLGDGLPGAIGGFGRVSSVISGLAASLISPGRQAG